MINQSDLFSMTAVEASRKVDAMCSVGLIKEAKEFWDSWCIKNVYTEDQRKGIPVKRYSTAKHA